jgi:hypothetical protein
VRPSAGVRKLPGKEIANGARRQLPKRKRRLRRPSASMREGPRRSASGPVGGLFEAHRGNVRPLRHVWDRIDRPDLSAMQSITR